MSHVPYASYPYGASASGLTSRVNAAGPSSSSTSGGGEVQVQMPRSFDLDEEVAGLRGKVKMLKSMSNQIGEEASIRGQLIDALEIDFSSGESAMRDIRRKLDKAYKQAKSGHLMSLMFFALSAFVGMFILIKFGRLIRAVTPEGTSVRHH